MGLQITPDPVARTHCGGVAFLLCPLNWGVAHKLMPRCLLRETVAPVWESKFWPTSERPSVSQTRRLNQNRSFSSERSAVSDAGADAVGGVRAVQGSF